MAFLSPGCKNQGISPAVSDTCKIIFLHHSTGNIIWKGRQTIMTKFKHLFGFEDAVPQWFHEYNKAHNTLYQISAQNFPKASPYGWNNYPYDYYNIWVKHAGNKDFKNEPTLETLASKYNLIIFKHCFPVGNIATGPDTADIESPIKTLANYKAQYLALREKMLEFPETKFLLWTPPALVEAQTTSDEARRTSEFTNWIINEWDLENDNIYLWDFYTLETEGGLYLKPAYAAGINDSHPGSAFAETASALFCKRIVDIIETNGRHTSLTGQTP